MRRHLGFDEIGRHFFEHFLCFIESEVHGLSPTKRKNVDKVLECWSIGHRSHYSISPLLHLSITPCLPSVSSLVRFRRFFLGWTAQAEAPRKNQPVCIEGAAAVQLARSAANAVLEVDDFMHRKILHESIVAHDLLEPIAVSEARHALEISLLHAAIRM